MNVTQRADIDGLEAFHVGCNLGHKENPRILWTKGDFNYLRCPICGLVWVDPQLTDVSVAKIYQQTFKGKLDIHPRPTNFLAYKARLNILQPYNRMGRLLDVGCFTGNFLLAAQFEGWTNVEGTEISLPAVSYARTQYDLTIHEGDLQNLELPENYYDAITLSDVIEHVGDPVQTLKRVYSLLRPGGVLYIDTPHFNSLPRLILGKDWSIFFPWHRTYFSASNMKLALETVGYNVVKIQTVGILPFSRFDPWKSYKSRLHTHVSTEDVKPSSSRIKNLLRPIWLGFKKGTEIPFIILSALGIQVGAKLIVHAVKPEDG
jgi:2-polyprenyl-3-methyl-5-hydroxy-6-metoxy-1,4-benzoquinol methylase